VTVFLGVVLAEYLTRRREHTQRFQGEWWNVVAMWNETFSDRKGDVHDRARSFAILTTQLGRVIASAIPPQHKWRTKMQEATDIFYRLNEHRDRWVEDGTAPDAGDVLGELLPSVAYHASIPTRIGVWVRHRVRG
jgi:hypothetical protein